MAFSRFTWVGQWSWCSLHGNLMRLLEQCFLLPNSQHLNSKNSNSTNILTDERPLPAELSAERIENVARSVVQAIVLTGAQRFTFVISDNICYSSVYDTVIIMVNCYEEQTELNNKLLVPTGLCWKKNKRWSVSVFIAHLQTYKSLNCQYSHSVNSSIQF